jgi:hypothetical protein
MSSRAERRQAKAVRRKKLLAERRRQTQAAARAPLAERMQRLAALPLDSCLVSEGLFQSGNGMVILARRTTDGRLALAAFLLDVFCRGVIDVTFHEMEPSDRDDFVADADEEAGSFAAADPAYGRKLLRDLVAYARAIGFEPHRDFAAAELLFGDVSAAACDVGFTFGVDGKPLYVPGLDESPVQIHRRLAHLRERLGPDGFDFVDLDEDVDEGDDAGDAENAEA